MESPGEYLKRERELRGVSLARIHETTRVPMKYLEAIERDDYEGVHPTFVKGYIKSYCKVLGLDETDAALRFEVYVREHAAEANRTETARPAVRKKTEEPGPVREGAKKGLNAFVLAAAGIVIVVIIYFVAVNKGPAPTVEPPKAQVEEVRPPEAPAPPAPMTGEQGTSAPPEAQIQQAEPQKTEKKAETPVEKAATPEKPPSAVKAAPQAPAQKPAVTAPAPVTVEMPQAAAEPAAKAHSLSVSASEQAWVKVGIDGSEPFDVLLREGESVSWKASENFQVTIGNAGGVDVTYDGKKLPRLGESGQVVHMTLPGGLPKVRPMPAPVAPKETEPAINMPAPAVNQE